jgi:tetratricopeptide (TPR) repeat protein/DNA-binding winged helix-turn-helix (wHTH) protein
MNSPNKQTYRLADIEVDLLRGTLRRNGRESYLREQALQIFRYLIEHRAETVTKEDLIDNVWQGTAVTDDALVQCIVEIRKALGDDSRNPQFIKTIPKVGYRFIAPIEELDSNQLATFETEEEVTSVDVELEEGINEGETQRRGDAATRRLLPSVPVSRRVRAGFVLALALILVTAVALVLHFQKSLWSPRRQLTETTLPQVPGKLPIAIMFFENRTGNSELDWLREGIADMLITDLSRSTKLVVLNRQQLRLMLEKVGYRQGEVIRLDQAFEVARRSRAEAIVLGSFAKVGEKVRIDVRLHNAQGQLLAAEGVNTERVEQILTDIDLLALKLAAHLGATPTDQQKKVPLVDVMTNNLEAYRYYSLALEKAAALHNKDAIALLKKAVAVDPQFAMAHARIGYAHAVTGNFADEAKPYLEKAFQLSHRLTDKDKLHIRAWYAIANLDYPGAIETYREIIARYPLEVEAYWRLGRLLDGEEQLEEAVEVFKQGLTIDEEAKDIYNALGGTYSALGRHEDAIAMGQRYLALAPKEPNAHDSLGLAYQWAGQYDRALEEYNLALALNASFERSILHVGNIYFQLGRYREAINQYLKYIELAPSNLERSRGFGRIAWVYWKKRDLEKAEGAARQEIRFEKTAVWNSLVLALERKDLTRAEKLKQQLDEFHYTSRGARTSPRYKAFFLGYLALKNGNTEEAIEKFKEAIKHRPPIWATDSYEDCLANAYLELGKLDEAIAEYERVLRLNPNYPLAHYHLAQAYEQKNQPQRARAEYERFLQIWNDADAEIPEVRVAKRQLNTST